ncbi:unnamed protein product [Heligmosomoides polygyrus]|uniref:CN hydrolase domain-containing protein n=1 Tax=Heligmosomoides polygyrus TaxID=6339 RepID=A0A183GQW1_HELPZ|nr:unnamed protein product [Heligmosomoides polygyrus]
MLEAKYVLKIPAQYSVDVKCLAHPEQALNNTELYLFVRFALSYFASVKRVSGIQLYLACTADDRDTWLPTMRMIALEGRCFVISSAQFMTSSAYPEGHPVRAMHGEGKVLLRGGSCAVDPLGNVLVEPDFSKELIHYVNIDLSRVACGKMDMDTVGHYSRPEVFQLIVNEKPFKAVVKQ